MKSNTDLSRRLHFDQNADLYDAGRNETDPAVVKAIMDSVQADGIHVLEVGAGTGQATGALENCSQVESVIALEPGGSMSTALANKFSSTDSKVTLVNSDFETYAPGTTFDLICSFNAFQWVKFPYGVLHARSLLAPNGIFAAAWSFQILNMHGVQDIANSIFADFRCTDFCRDRSSFELDSITRINEGQQEVVGTGAFRLRSQIVSRNTLESHSGSYVKYIRSLANGSELSSDAAAALSARLPSRFQVLELTIASVYEQDGWE